MEEKMFKFLAKLFGVEEPEAPNQLSATSPEERAANQGNPPDTSSQRGRPAPARAAEA